MPEQEYDLGTQYGEVFENFKLDREGILKAQANFAKILGITGEEQEARTKMTTSAEKKQTDGTVTPHQDPQGTLNQTVPNQSPKVSVSNQKKKRTKTKAKIPPSDRQLRSSVRSISKSLESTSIAQSQSLISTDGKSQEVNKETEAIGDTGDSSMGLAGIRMASWLGLERRAVDFGDADVFVFKSQLIPDKLPPISPALLAELGNCKIKASFQSSPYTPGEGFLLRCTAGYFATLPFIGHSTLTLSVVHCLARKNIKMDIDSNPEIAEGVKLIEGCNLGSIGTVVSQLVIPPRALSGPVLEDVMPLGDMVNLIDQIAVCDLDTKICFSLLGHILGLKEALPGMPDFLKFSDLIINFVNAVAKGKKPKELITINWPSVYTGTARADTINLHGMLNESDLATSELGKTLTVADEEVIRKRKMLEAAALTSKYANVGDPMYFDISGVPSGSEGQATPQLSNPRLKKFKPKGQISDQWVTKAEMVEIIRKQELFNNKTDEKINLLTAKADRIIDLIGAFDQSLVDVIARLCCADMYKRVNLNAGKFDPSKPGDVIAMREEGIAAATELKRAAISSDFMGIGRPSAKKLSLIEKLQAKNILRMAAEVLVVEVQEMLAGTFHESIGKTLTAQKIQSDPFRARLVEVLKTLPEMKNVEKPIDLDESE